MAKSKTKAPPPIAQNRRARHDYELSDRFEAGIALAGWELKSIRSLSTIVAVGASNVYIASAEYIDPAGTAPLLGSRR